MNYDIFGGIKHSTNVFRNVLRIAFEYGTKESLEETLS